MRSISITCEEIVQIYKENRDALDKTAENVVQLLDERAEKISTGESCTGGLLSELITAVSGASAVFEMGVCTYSDRMKQKLLHVPESILIEHTAVSSQTAEAMVLGLRQESGAELCISITGIAGPSGGTEAQPVGTVYAGVLYRDTLCVTDLQLYRVCRQERHAIRHAAAVCAFGIALRILMEDEECRS